MDKYLKRLAEMERILKEREGVKKRVKEIQEAKERYSEFKEGYKKERKYPGLADPVRNAADSYLNYHKKDGELYCVDGKVVNAKEKGEILNTASTLMSMAQKENNSDDAIKGAKVYELLGVGNRASVKKRLLKVYEKNPGPLYLEDVKAFFKRNPEEKEGKGLEKKFIPVIAGFSLIVSLFFLSPNITGNVVGNLTKNSSNIIGLILLVIGLIGLLIYFKRK